MVSSSPYEISQSGSPEWKPGEQLAASGFVAIVFFLVLDINAAIYRVFKKKQGLYYWSMVLGTLGSAINGVGQVFEYLMPFNPRLWGLRIALLLVGFSMYAPAQLLILHSRLHLVDQNRKLQRWVLSVIVSTSFVLLLPAWVADWPAWDIDGRLPSMWSPREAIIDRCNQLGFTLVECFLSGIYVWSLLKLLRLKSSIRRRRVMLDLVYVNVTAVVSTLLHYILKFKLEFIVLNQLMAVAARGVKRETFEERRYYHPSIGHTATAGRSKEKPSSSQIELESIKIPPQARVQSRPLVLPAPNEVPHDTFLDESSSDANHHEVDTVATQQPNYSGEDSHLLNSFLPEGNHSLSSRLGKISKIPTLHLPRNPFGRRQHDGRVEAKVKKHTTRENGRKDDHEDEEEEEIGIHMWENRGKLIMEVPWFERESAV